jgi:DNA-binding CsgD family transcriptional regulator
MKLTVASQALRSLFLAVGEASEHGAAEAETGALHLIQGVGRIVGAESGYALLTRRGPRSARSSHDGWLRHLEVAPGGRDRASVVAQWVAARPDHLRDPPLLATLAGAGERHRVVVQGPRMFQRWRRSATEELLDALGVAERANVALAVSPRVELYLGFDRTRGAFRRADLDLLAVALHGLRPFAASFARSAGLLDARAPLSRREREVLRGLLGGMTEKRLAPHLGLTVRSLHQIVVSVYRKLRVHSRAELTALGTAGRPGAAHAG